MSEILGDKLNIVYEDTLLEITPELMKKTILKQNKEIERLKEENKDLKLSNIYLSKTCDKYKMELERLNNIINEALGIANERFNYYSNHKNNNEEHLEDWGNIFNILLRGDNK